MNSDHDNLCVAVRFYSAAREAGVKPIIGVELATTEGHLTLLAANYDGYGKLCQAVSRLHLEHGAISPEHHLAGCKNIIVLSGCDKGVLVRALSGERPGAFAARYKEMFGDRYIMVQIEFVLKSGVGVAEII